MKGIAGRVAIVTGGAGGIGSAVTEAFAAAGARVVIADLAEAPGRALATRLGDPVRFLATDLRRDADLERLVAFSGEAFGAIDFVVCVACSYADPGPEATRADWINGLEVNLVGHVLLVQKALPWLRKSSCASVVNFSSGSASFALSGRWVYPASKAAIEQVTRSQALDLAADGVRVNAVRPAWTAKPDLAKAPPEQRERYEGFGRRFHMLGRAGTGPEVADAVLFLCSAHAAFITGSVLRVDGGHTALGPQGRDRILPSAVRPADA